MKRFWDKVEKTPTCWLWHGPTNTGGYGHILINRKFKKAHRMAYELMVGPIPKGLQLDHLCRNRSCVNPEHLEVVTGRENIIRGMGPSAINARKTICKRGHSLENADINSKGERVCRICSFHRHKNWQALHRIERNKRQNERRRNARGNNG